MSSRKQERFSLRLLVLRIRSTDQVLYMRHSSSVETDARSSLPPRRRYLHSVWRLAGELMPPGRTHKELRLVIDSMTSSTAYKLGQYQMSLTQWDMLSEANECLEVFEEPTHIHSQKGVALIHEVILHMLLLKFRLELMRDAAVINPRTGQTPRLVIRVAAFAALNVVNKYLKLMESAYIYWLAIVLCPWSAAFFRIDSTTTPPDLNPRRVPSQAVLWPTQLNWSTPLSIYLESSPIDEAEIN
ncbi:unnamed protein product, partial [Rhizoctonia solani]